MAEVTRVPLQPIQKGSLAKLWLGILLLVLAGAALAWAFVPKLDQLADGVTIETLEEGMGVNPGPTDYVRIAYKGTLKDGTLFDENGDAVLQVNRVVPGFSTALQAMQTGGRYRIQIPADQGYGEQGGGAIPPNSDLTFEVTLLEFRSEAEIMQEIEQQQMLEQLMQMQQQGEAGTAPQ